MKRIKAAFRTNGPQATTCIVFTLLNCVAAGMSSGWGAWLMAVTMWPLMCFMVNLMDPIQPEDNPHE